MSNKNALDFIKTLNKFLDAEEFDTVGIINNTALDHHEDNLQRMFTLYTIFETCLKDFYAKQVSIWHNEEGYRGNYICFDHGFLKTMWVLYFEKYHSYLNQIIVDSVELTTSKNIESVYQDFAHSPSPLSRLLRTANEVYKMILLGFGSCCENYNDDDEDGAIAIAQQMLSVVIHMERAIVLHRTRPLCNFTRQSAWIDWLCLRDLKASANKEVRMWAKSIGHPTICDAITELPDAVREPFLALLYPAIPESMGLSKELTHKIDQICGACIRDHQNAAEGDDDEEEEEEEEEEENETETKNESESGVMVEDADDNYDETTPILLKKNL